MCCLAVMCSAASRFTWRKLALSAALVLISISVRKIGITLIPVLVWIVLTRTEVRRRLMHLSVGMKAAIGAVAVLATGIVVWLFFIVSMMRRFAMIENASTALRGHTVVDSVSSILAFHFKELGEIAINFPFPALGPMIQRLVPFVGAAVFLLVLGGLVSRRRQLGVVDIFFISYGTVILVWPFYDPRFWLPVLPFLVAYAGLSMRYFVRKGISAHLFEAWVLGFLIMGLPTLAFGTMVTFSGVAIGDLYNTELYHATYCAAGYCKRGFDSTQAVNQDALRVLQAFK